MSPQQKLVRLLLKNKISLATAESCTAGLLAYLLTQVPGSSAVFKGGVVVYSLQAKHTFLSLPKTLLKETDGVSSEVARLLAQRIRKKLSSDIGISIVGFAGPHAPSQSKVGIIFIAIADKKCATVTQLLLKGTRNRIRTAAALKAITLLSKHVTKT